MIAATARATIVRVVPTTADDFTALYAAQHADALRLAYLLCGDAQRAEDTVADAWVKIWRRVQRGGIEHPQAYVRRAVVNEVNSRFRRLRLERREAERQRGDDRGTRGHAEQLADEDLTFRALQALPARMRVALVLRYWHDLPEADIADAMGISVGTVKSTLSRGLAKLRTQLGDEEAGR